MAFACRVYGHRVRFWIEGETMRWGCERECDFEGSKTYASVAEARRYAAAFDREDRYDFRHRAPVSLFPLRLGGRGRTRA
jgi:hypothetical protein